MRLSLPGLKGNLYFSVLAANLAAAAVGTQYTWSSPTIPRLQESGSSLPLTDEQASWLGSLTALGTVFGPYLGGWLLDLVGRRWTIFSAVVLGILSWGVVLPATTVWQIYIGRFLGGMAGGIVFLSNPTYVAEISEPDVRGALGTIFGFFLVGGFLMEYIFGPFVSYSALIFINLVPSIAFFLLFAFIPESPHYSLRKGNFSEAVTNLSWLRTGRRLDDVKNETNVIRAEVHRSMAEKVKLSDLVSTRGNRKGLLIACGMVAGQQLSGINVVLFYAQSIFIMSGTSFSSSVSSIVVGALLFIVQGLAAPIVRCFGMKNMFIFSAIGMSIFQVVLGVYFYFNQREDMSAYGWVPVISLIGYILTYSVGFGPLAFAVMGEMFPSNVKAIAAAVTVSFAWFLSFLLTKFFNNISELIGPYVAFFLFAFFCVVALFFTIFVLPDTRGLTLQEILDLLDGR